MNKPTPKTKETKELRKVIRRLNKRIRELEDESTKSFFDNASYKNFCRDIVNCMAECANQNKTINNEYWLKRSKELWK